MEAITHCPSGPLFESEFRCMVSSLSGPSQVECGCIPSSFRFKSAIGGVLRDHNGNFICLFSSPIPTMNINSAEILAIHRAIKTHLSCEQIAKSNVCIESDSRNAIQWCSNHSGGHWNLNFILNFIRSYMLKGNVQLMYKGRKSDNFVADSLAKQGLDRNDEFLTWV